MFICLVYSTNQLIFVPDLIKLQVMRTNSTDIQTRITELKRLNFRQLDKALKKAVRTKNKTDAYIIREIMYSYLG